MSLRPSGIWCDVCNIPMVGEMLLNKPIQQFTLGCSPSTMHCHDECAALIDPAVTAIDPSLLPDGSPLGNLLRRVREHNASVPKRAEGDE